MAARDVFLATDGMGVVRAARGGDGWSRSRVLDGARFRALAVDARWVFAGGDGVWRSEDAGATWRRAGLEGRTVTTLAARGDLLVAGLKPAGIAVSADRGATWSDRAFPKKWWWFTPSERPMHPYVQALAIPRPGTIVAGVEVGGVWWSQDDGATWTPSRGAILDCHALAAHPRDPDVVAQGGAGLAPAAMSRDGGRTFATVAAPAGRRYGWAVAVEPRDPSVLYHSASTGPFAAHGSGDARAVVMRRSNGGSRAVGGSWRSMPYVIVAEEGRVLAALADGTVQASQDEGETWVDTGARLGRVERAFVAVRG